MPISLILHHPSPVQVRCVELDHTQIHSEGTESEHTGASLGLIYITLVLRAHCLVWLDVVQAQRLI